jgi:regulator of nucleoside diphosphate kinase
MAYSHPTEEGASVFEAVKTESALPPHIVAGSDEHRKLTKLASGYAGHVSEDADTLLQELERAEVLPDASLPNDVVKMDSFVRFQSSSGGERTIQLVFPEQADISAGRV